MTEKKTPKSKDAEIDENLENLVEDEGESPEVAEQSAKEEKVDYKLLINDLNDKVIRAAAEVQNTKRRAEIDIQKARNFSIESFAKDLLGVMDNLTRALDTISDEDTAKEPKLKSMKDGIEITGKELAKVFERNKIKCIDPLGEKFDHNFHQAISQVEDEKAESGTVVSVMQTGYVINDRVLRPAMVVVAK